MQAMKTVILSMLMLLLALPEKQVQAQEQYVYSVRVKRGSKQYVQTGFRLSGTTGIITALHGVVGGDRIKAVNNEAKTFTGLKIVRVDLAHDLALLRNTKLENEPDEGFTKSDSDPQPGQKVSVWGHPYGIDFTKKEDVFIGNPAKRILAGFIEARYAKAFDKRRSPDTQAEVLYLEGNMVAGHSGAPLIDPEEGSVLGIVNGGLGGGAAAITWAIPVQEINFSRSFSSAKVRLEELAALHAESLYEFQEDPDYSPIDDFNMSAVVKIVGQGTCGTGFFVRTSDGSVKIITASHVVGDKAISVSGMDENGTRIVRDAVIERRKFLDKDLALLSVNLNGWSVTPLTLGNSSGLLDEELTGFGYGGEGIDQCNDDPGLRTATVEKLNNETLELISPTQGEETSIRDGDSGGPLLHVNDNGEFVVVGMIQDAAPGIGPAIALASTLLHQVVRVTNQTDSSPFYTGRLGRFPMSSASWCSDILTLWCWNKKGRFFNGVRALFEPNLGTHWNNKGANEVINQEELWRNYRIGLEVNVVAAFVSVQGALFFPDEIELYEDPDPVIGRNPALRVLKDMTDNRIKSSLAWEVGLSFLDGWFSVGAGTFRYQEKEFRRDRYSQALRDRFIYVKFQPVSFLRSILKPDVSVR